MKPVRIDFVPDGRWHLVWAVVALLGAFAISAALWLGWQANQSAHGLEGQIAISKQQAMQLQTPSTPAANPRHGSTVQAAKLLGQDLNKVLATVEAMKEEGVRLRSLSLDADAGTLRLEYELDSLAGAMTVTAVLNAGYEARPWQLEGVSSVAGGTSGGLTRSSQVLRASWVTQIDKL